MTTEPETGGLRAATLAADNGTSEVSAEIRYEEDPMVKLLVPIMMQQRYTRSSDPRADVLEVSSTYSNWRRFEVKTTEAIGPPK